MLPRWNKKGIRWPRHSDGFLLPAVIAIGLGISTMSVLALQTVAQNSVTLYSQHYDQLAREAASAGTNTALLCIQQSGGSVSWGATAANSLKPGTNCNGMGTASNITDNNIYTSTYEVSRIDAVDQMMSSGNLEAVIITSKGIVTIKGSGSRTIEQTARTIVRASGGSGGTKTIGSLSTGPASACAVTKNEGRAYCWGSNSNGQLGSNSGNRSAPNPVNTNASALPTVPARCGGLFQPSCTSLAQDPSDLASKFVVKVSVGRTHACAIAKPSASASDTTQKAYCWGKNDYGQLGNVSTADSTSPVAVDTSGASSTPTPGIPAGCGGFLRPACSTNPQSSKPASPLASRGVIDISAGNDFTCAILDNGSSTCWGKNSDGQLGRGGTADTSYPVAVSMPSAVSFKKLAIIKNNATTMCAIANNDDGYCWGKADVGQTGDGRGIDSATRYGADDERHTNPNRCDELRAEVYDNAWRQAGGYPHADDDETRPVKVAGTWKFRHIVINNSETTGDNYENIYLGSGTDEIRAKGTSWGYVTALTTTGRAVYWGGERKFDSFIDCVRNGNYNGSDWSRAEAKISRSYSGRTSPTLLYNSASSSGEALNQSTPLGLMSVGFLPGSAYGALICATTGGYVYCDSNDTGAREGQLGSGFTQSCSIFGCSPSEPTTPQRVTYTSEFNPGTQTILDTGDSYTCILSDGSVYCWGKNNTGQLGRSTGSTNYSPVPVAIDTSGALAQTASASILDISTATSF